VIGLLLASVVSLPFACDPGTEGDGALPDGTVIGAVSSPYPTQRGISLEWAIGGDANTNGRVVVRYRKQGAATWIEGMPLRRVPADANEGFSWKNRHSGSLFSTAPGTTYDVELQLVDPDGGCAVKSLTVDTPSIPKPAADGRVRAARPGNLGGVLGSAQPGDIIELQAGTYAGFAVPVDGTAARPIVLRASGRVVVNGEIGLYFRKHVQVRGLIVHGRIRANGSTGVAIIGNRISGSPEGGIQVALDSSRAYIANNTVIGATVWRESSLGVSGDNSGEGILVTGPGHVIERNTARGWRDCISTLEDSEAIDQFSIDIRRNDLRECADDAIEADFCFHNCRIVENRILNSFVAMSSQPSLGGPTYFVRNTAYNILYAPFKLYRGSVGDVLLHNTTVKYGDAFNIYSGVTHSRQYTRNNLFLGGPGDTFNGYSGGNGLVMSLEYAAGGLGRGSYDFDGFGTTASRFRGSYQDARFVGLAELRSMTPEKHALKVGFGIFASGVAYPNRPFHLWGARNFALESGANAIDAGQVVPGINAGYTGAAPDLGAREFGQPAPAVGAP
jgi:hypothetical protein